MEDPPICRGKLCRLCHGDFKTKFEQQAHDAPYYARPTSASTRRSIAIRLASPRKSTSKVCQPKLRISFEDLPTEVRLQIYRACLRQGPAGGIIMAGWVKGGGFHADRTFSMYASKLYLQASHSFTKQILMLNKRIHGEALQEIYKNITFNICTRALEPQLPQMEYWFTQHPLRFTNRLQFDVSITIIDRERMSWMPRVDTPTDQLQRLSRIFSKAAHLKHFEMTVLLNVDFAAEGLSYCNKLIERLSKKLAWRGKLAAIVSKLPSGCKTSMVVKAQATTGNLVLLKIEAAIVSLASELKTVEVSHFKLDGHLRSLAPRSGLCIHQIHLGVN